MFYFLGWPNVLLPHSLALPLAKKRVSNLFLGNHRRGSVHLFCPLLLLQLAMSQQCDQFRVCLLFLVFPFKKKKNVIANDYILKIHFHVELNQQPFEKTVKPQIWRERKAPLSATWHHFLALAVFCGSGLCRAGGCPPVLRQAGPVLGPRHWGCCLKCFQEPNSRKCIHEP